MDVVFVLLESQAWGHDMIGLLRVERGVRDHR